jgi:1,4-dihydroxy-2-naphthoate octaprenyltransferase
MSTQLDEASVPPTPAVAPGSAGAWWLAARPGTLVAGLVPVLVGAACASRAGGAHLGAALASLLGALALQIGTNFANDAADFERGADDHRRLGPPRAAQAGLLSPAALRRGVLAAFAVASAAGVYLIALRGWPIVAIGLASMAAGVAYTAGPFPLAYLGLGELFVVLFFGFVAVCGTAFALTGAVPALAWSAALPVAASATMLLVVNNLRDEPTDRDAGKRTLVVRWGRRFGEREYLACILVLYAAPAVWLGAGVVGWRGVLPWLSLPLAWGALRALRAAEGAALNPVLQKTAALLLVHGLLVAAALVEP